MPPVILPNQNVKVIVTCTFSIYNQFCQVRLSKHICQDGGKTSQANSVNEDKREGLSFDEQRTLYAHTYRHLCVQAHVCMHFK